MAGSFEIRSKGFFMIAMDPTSELRAAIAEQIGVNVVDKDVFTVDVPWSFPDGDRCRVMVSKRGDGLWSVSDGGASIIRASYTDDTNLLDRGYVDRFRNMIQLYGLSEVDGELVAHDSEDVGEAVFLVSQASIDAVQLSRLPREKVKPKKSHFQEKLGKLIRSAVPSDMVESDWTDETEDEDRLYPVSYRVNRTALPPLFVLGVESNSECVHATMSCLFHKRFRRDFRSAAIISPRANFRRRERARLEHEVTATFELSAPESIRQFLTTTTV